MISCFYSLAAVRYLCRFVGFVGLGVLLVSESLAQTELDMLVVYTQAVEDYYGDADGVLAHVQASIVSANTGFENSGNETQLVLRDLQKISYVEDSSLPNDLSNISSSEEVAALRDQVGADLVCLFRNGNAGGFAGYAWILGSAGGSPSGGFSVISAQSAISSLSFQHEVGHNLGAAHDRDNASVTGIYDYSFGYRFTGTNATQYRTIMAYSPGQRINYFSNPNVSYQGAATGVATGAAAADNARTFSLSSQVVEVYRDRVADGSNSPPTLVQAIPDQEASIGESFGLDVSPNFNDIDIGDVLSFSATVVGGGSLPVWLSLDSVTGVFSGTPTESDVELISVEVTTSDGEGSVSASFDIEVKYPNNPPVLINPVLDQTAYVDALFTIDISSSFEDADGDTLQFVAVLENEDPLPDWLTIDLETGVFSGTPSSGDVGTISILLAAFDREDVAIDSFVLTVEFPNNSPVLVEPIPDQAAIEDSLFSLDVSSHFADSDSRDILSFVAELTGGGSIPAWLLFDQDSGAFSGTPANGDVGVLSIEVTASDGVASVSDAFDLTVGNVNDAPTLLSPIADQAAVEDVAFSFDVSPYFGDPDVGDALSFGAALSGGGNLPTWLSFDPVFGVLFGIPLNADVGSLSIEVTASDGVASVSDVFDLFVGNANDAPALLSSVVDQGAVEDVSFTLDVSPNFGDVDVGDSLSFSASLVGGGDLPAWLGLDLVTGVFSGTPLNADVGTVSIEVAASDGVASVSDVFDLSVVGANDAPALLSGIVDQGAVEDVSFTFDVSPNFWDVDAVDTLSFGAALVGGGDLPTWLGFDPDSGVFSGTPLNADVGAVSIEVTASDGVASVSDVFDLFVGNANDAPALLSGIVDQNAVEDVAYSLDVSSNFGDVDVGDVLSFSAVLVGGGDLPAWLGLDPDSGVFSGMPLNADVGTVSIEVTASDGVASISDVFDLSVGNVNDAPALLSGIVDQGAVEDVAFTLDVSPNFGDVDVGDVLSFSAVLVGGGDLPAWLGLDPDSGVFSGMPLNADVGTVSIEVTASDGVASVSDVFDLSVVGANDTPALLSGIVDQGAVEDVSFTFDVSPNFGDVDAGDVLSFSAALLGGGDLPAWLSLGSVSGVFSGTPLNADVGTVSIEVTASDGVASVSDVFDLSVVGANDTPALLSGIVDQGAVEDVAFTFDVSPNFGDVDAGDTLSFGAALVGGGDLPSWLGFDPDSGVFSGTPLNADVGTVSIEVTASDGVASVSDVFDLSVVGANDAPALLSSVVDQGAVEDVAFSFDVSPNFGDVDVGDSLSFSASLVGGGDLPAWLGLDPDSGVFSGTPLNADVGTVSIEVTASDGVASVSDVFDLSVVGVNDAPALLSGIVDQGAVEDVAFTFDVLPNFGDVDVGDVLSFSAALVGGGDLPDWLGFDPDSGVFSGTPLNADVGTVSIEVTALDGVASVSDVFDLSVVGANDAPALLSGIVDQGAVEDVAFTFDVSPNFGDVDVGDVLSFSAALVGGGDLPAWLDLDPDSGVFSGTPLNADVGTVSIEVTASDGVASVSGVFDLSVGNVNDAPALLSGIVDQGAVEDGSFTFDVSPNFGDVDVGDSLSFSASLVGGGDLPAWLGLDPDSGVFSGTPLNADVGTVSIEVTASDGVASVSDVFDLSVVGVNDAPALLSGIVDQGAVEDVAFTFDVSPNFGDVDVGDVLSFSAALVGGGDLPDWLGLDPDSGVFSGTPLNADVGTVSIEVTASDGVASVSDVFDLSVVGANDAPALLSSVVDQGAVEDVAFTLDVSPNFGDVDAGDSLSFSAALVGGGDLPAWLGFDPDSGVFSGTPLNADVGTVSIEVTASDGVASVSDVFDLEVESGNRSPVSVSELANRVVRSGTVFDFSISSFFEDPDEGDVLTYSATLEDGNELPGWVHFNSDSGAFSGWVAASERSWLKIRVTASDGLRSVSRLFRLDVIASWALGIDEGRLVLELSDFSNTRTYALWESKDLVNWQLSEIQPIEVGEALRFDLPCGDACFYRVEISD